MINIGNRIIKVARWYTAIRLILNAIAGTTFVILSYVLPKDGTIIWVYFWVGLGFYLETLVILLLRYVLYGLGIMVCASAYKLAQKRVVTYLDLKEAQRKYAQGKITKEQMDAIEVEYYQYDQGLIEKE